MIAVNRSKQTVKLPRILWSAVVAGIMISGTCSLNAADEAPSPQSAGFLPDAAPVDITGSIAALPDNWKDWGTALSGELSALYEPGADVAAERRAIATLRKRVETARRDALDPRFRPILNALVSISGGLERRLDVIEAALDTLERGPQLQSARVSAARTRVAREAQALGTYLGSVRNGSEWDKYLLVHEVQNAVDHTPVDEAAAPLSKAQSRWKEMNSIADNRSREFLSRPQFASYEKAVDGYLSALTAPSSAADNPDLHKGLKDLLAALEDYESTHSGASATAVRKAFDAIRGKAPDGGERVGQALTHNYFNYNLRVVASEAYLNKLVHQSRDEAGPVRDFILGADVYGNQTTHTDVGLKLVPNGSQAQFDMLANGAVASSTLGYTDQATVSTEGHHYFTAAKRVTFDGERFWTAPARIGVNANNTTTGADTNIGFPFHGIADAIAMGRAESMSGESEAIAASRVQDRVLPPFNSQVDSQFQRFNSDVAARLEALRELNLYPDAKSWSTTDSELKVATRLMGPGELGGSEPSPAMYLGRGLTVVLHDSLMNGYADRLDLAGKSLTDDEIKAKIEAQLSKLLGRDVKFSDEKGAAPADESSIKKIIFDKTDPLRMHADDGSLVLTIRAGFQQEGKEDIPTQIITLPLKFSVDMKNVVIEPGDISIEAAEKAERPAQQLARAGVIRKKLDAAFPRREIDRVHRIQRKNLNVVTAVTRIRALDCWLSVTYE
ncbi:MAG TPA: hypothetical protein VGH74_01805 [Planctomycetaceae bacterium]